MSHASSRTIAATLVDLLGDPVVVARANVEFDERTGGGIGGTDWLARSVTTSRRSASPGPSMSPLSAATPGGFRACRRRKREREARAVGTSGDMIC
jgi:hypothetical protein